MRVQPFWAAAAVATLALAPLARAQGADPWLHVRVDEVGAHQSKVAVNLPLSLVQIALEAAPEHVVNHGCIHIGRHSDHDLKVADLRRMWTELKKSGDAELVNVEEEDQKVRVARQGDLVLVHVEEPTGKEKVRVEVPTDVVDALLSGEGDELNVKAALTQLQKRRGDIVRVHDHEQSVRVWIDEAK
jgi:hypothetical protein